jgi:hypothetical protein
VTTIDEYWQWLEKSFVSTIRAQTWYNGEAPRNLSGYIGDKTNRLLGWMRMRQVRVKNGSCPSRLTAMMAWVRVCRDEYRYFDEDKQSYGVAWSSNVTANETGSSIERAFRYRSGDELDGYGMIGDHGTYGSGGYVYEFRGRLHEIRANLSSLHALGWIDVATRAVLIEMSLYNPNVNLFVSVVVLGEFVASGWVHGQIRVDPLSVEGE